MQRERERGKRGRKAQVSGKERSQSNSSAADRNGTEGSRERLSSGKMALREPLTWLFIYKIMFREMRWFFVQFGKK